MLADEQLATWLAAVRSDPGPRLQDQDLAAVRDGAVARARSRPAGPDVHRVEDLVTDSGLRLRRYEPHPKSDVALIYLHGGGFVFGDLDTHDALCRRLAVTVEATVISVDYRRAPEHPAPAAIDDAIEAYRWLLENDGNAPTRRIALAGDSAGGAIALLAAATVRRSNGNLAALVLLYPNTDMTLSQPSIHSKGTGWGLEATDLAWLITQWIPNEHDRQNPQFDPLHAELDGLPPTMIVTAEHDPLHDEGAVLAERLRAAGVATTHLDEPGMVHGFLSLSHLSPAADLATHRAFHLFKDALRQVRATPNPGHRSRTD